MARHLSESRTEDLVMDLLRIQGWQNTSRPPKGSVVRKNEYKDFSTLAPLFRGRSKSGSGDAYPDFLIVDPITLRPLAVIESKAHESDFDLAVKEACEDYADACRNAGHSVLAIGIAGQEKSSFRVGVFKHFQGEWKPISYQEQPITWLPTPNDLELLVATASLLDLAPVIPRPEILAEKADLINRQLREASVKDEYRPAYIGAMMLALWHSRGNIRRDRQFILRDINDSCEQAFSRAGKSELAKSLHIDEANSKLAASAWDILATLEKLNVATASFAHDYLGQLYEAFFRYTGGNTIGQYFTPRHIARFMADICETASEDKVIDPACGTGGFLVACIKRAFEVSHVKYEDVVRMVRDKLVGYESEPVTAALCVANMILRGDGTTGIRKDNCFHAEDYPASECQVALMNPPFPHKRTDVPPQRFVERALEALDKRGKLAVILPTSILVKKELQPWRKKILSRNSLAAVCQLPDELFQPYASSTTSIVVLEKGLPHSSKQQTVFVRVQYDGWILKKSARVPRPDGKNQLEAAEDAILNKKSIPGFSGSVGVADDAEWSPGAYIPSALPTQNELQASIDELMRRLASFYIRYAAEVAELRNQVESRQIQVSDYRDQLSRQRIKNADSLPRTRGTIGELFDIYYGQKALHSRENLSPGSSLIISPTEQYNGCYGWLAFEPLIHPPFITVAQTGTIGEAFVQMEPCGVNDDCLLLMPRQNASSSLAKLFLAAAVIRLERWRFSYGRKLTPSRICDFPVPDIPDLEHWVDAHLARWADIWEAAIQGYAGNGGSIPDTQREASHEEPSVPKTQQQAENRLPSVSLEGLFAGSDNIPPEDDEP